MAILTAPEIRFRDEPTVGEMRRLQDELGLPRAAAILAWQRVPGNLDAKSWESHTSPDPADQHDPFLLPDMERAVERLNAARESGEQVLVHGDYDADGLTGTAILTRALSELGMKVKGFVPNREKHGYGLSREVTMKSAAEGTSLLVSVDCGSSDGELIDDLMSQGCETIVTDHHLATDLPEAFAFVSPQRPDSQYPHRDLSGSATAYKLAHALYRYLERPQPPERWLDLATVGTVADVLPLTGENRLLVAGGLREISKLVSGRENIHPVWKALKQSARLSTDELSSVDIAFRIAPRLNAAGRVGSPMLALKLLRSDDPAQAAAIAKKLDALNQKRRGLEEKATREALALARKRLGSGSPPRVLVLKGDGWHPGVIGISASRLVEEFGLPTFLATARGDGTLTGSGRGLPGGNLKEHLDAASEKLLRHGGHRQAAGFSLDAGDWDGFVSLMDERAPAPPEPEPLLVDLKLEPEETDRGFLDVVEKLGPFGAGNREPLIFFPKVRILGYDILKDEHLRLRFASGDGGALKAIGFRKANSLKSVVDGAGHLDMVVRVGRDTWQRRPGEHGVSFFIEDLRPDSSSAEGV